IVTDLQNVCVFIVAVVDSSGKPVDGLLEGTLAFLGAFDECLDTVVLDETLPERLFFRGQYCTAQVAPKWALSDLFHNDSEAHRELASYLPKKAVSSNALRIPGNHVVFRIGLCVPSTCSREDIEKIVKYSEHVQNTVNAIQAWFRHFIFSYVPYISRVLLLVFLSLTVIGSSVDVFLKERQVQEKSLLCFSAHTNARKLLMPEDKAGSLGALHGIRFLSMTWIIFGHTYFFIE
ncbi:unnamed protein product, partial [Ixodes persulcatus]